MSGRLLVRLCNNSKLRANVISCRKTENLQMPYKEQ